MARPSLLLLLAALLLAAGATAATWNPAATNTHHLRSVGHGDVDEFEPVKTTADGRIVLPRRRRLQQADRNLDATDAPAAGLAASAAGSMGSSADIDGGDVSVIQVNEPFQIAGPKVHRDALFGPPQYGKTLTGTVVYTTQTGCSPFQPDPSWPTGPIVMLDRGGCTFVTKVRNAEAAGAMAVIVADTTPVCGPASDGGTATCPPCNICPFVVSECECALPLMADDGSGGDIGIPAMLLSYADANAMKACLAGKSPCSAKEHIVVTMHWYMPTATTVPWQMWSAAGDSTTETFRNNFAPIVPLLGTAALFTPHFYIYNGTNWGCDIKLPNGKYPCDNQCTNAGRYCLPDPDGNLDVGVSGADVVRESLRQICIWQQANTTYSADFGAKWWSYANQFDSMCVGTLFNSDQCADQQQQSVNLDPEVTYKCMTNAGGTADTNDNVYLRESLALRKDLHLSNFPTVMVHGIIERGSTTAANTLTTICAGLKASAAPRVCNCQALNVADIQACATAQTLPGAGGGLSPGIIALLVCLSVGLVAAVIGGVFLYRRAMRRMRQDVHDIMAQYVPLSEQHAPTPDTAAGAADINKL